LCHREHELEIAVWLRCHVQVDLGARAGSAERFTALGGDGQQMPIVVFRGPPMKYGELEKIVDGKSEVVVVRDTCETIVLYDAQGAKWAERPSR
jgi:hypothetical protein